MAQGLADGEQQVAGAQDRDAVRRRAVVAQVEGDEVGAIRLQGGDEQGQIFGIGLSFVGGQLRGRRIGHDLQGAADQQPEFRYFGGQFGDQVAFDFGHGLLGGEAFDERQFTQNQQNMARPLGGGRSGPGEEHVGIYEDAELSLG